MACHSCCLSFFPFHLSTLLLLSLSFFLAPSLSLAVISFYLICSISFSYRNLFLPFLFISVTVCSVFLFISVPLTVSLCLCLYVPQTGWVRATLVSNESHSLPVLTPGRTVILINSNWLSARDY